MHKTPASFLAVYLTLTTAPAWSQNLVASIPQDRAAIEQAQVQRAEQDRQISEAAQQVMQAHGIAGLAIALTDHGTRRFYNYGVASRDTGQPVSSETLFELGSISKTFTATLAAWAQAQGRLKLSDSIDTYLPVLHGSWLGKVPVLHLATHTSGDFPLQVPPRIQNEKQLMTWFQDEKLHEFPTPHRKYANPSVGLLGLIAAKSLGQPFVQAMEQGLFPALGLSATFLNVPAGKQVLYAQGYDKQDAPVRLNPGVLADEAYGVKSSSRDLLHFVEANMASAPGNDLLQQALKATHTGYFTFGPAKTVQALIWEQYAPPVSLEALLAGNANDMALKAQPVAPLKPPRPAAPGTWINKTGSTNGFGGYVAFVPDRQLGIVILANRNYPNADRVRLAQHILTLVDTPAQP